MAFENRVYSPLARGNERTESSAQAGGKTPNAPINEEREGGYGKFEFAT